MHGNTGKLALSQACKGSQGHAWPGQTLAEPSEVAQQWQLLCMKTPLDAINNSISQLHSCTRLANIVLTGKLGHMSSFITTSGDGAGVAMPQQLTSAHAPAQTACSCFLGWPGEGCCSGLSAGPGCMPCCPTCRAALTHSWHSRPASWWCASRLLACK